MKKLDEVLKSIADNMKIEDPYYYAEIIYDYLMTESDYELYIKHNDWFDGDPESYCPYDSETIKSYRKSKVSFAEKDFFDLLKRIFRDISFPNVEMLPRLIYDKEHIKLYLKKNLCYKDETITVDMKISIYIVRRSSVNYDSELLHKTIEAYNNIRIYENEFKEG